MSRGEGANGDAPRRTYLSREERRAQIVEATLSILAEDGLHALTTSTLAGRVGVSEATLFKHFESKDAILAEALRRQAAELRERIEAFRSEAAPWERATGLVRHVLDYLEERDGGPLVILLGHASRIRPEMEAEMNRTLGRFRERIATFLDDEVRPEGTVEAAPPLDPGTAADLLIAVGQSSALRWMVGGRVGSPSDRAAPMLRALERCLARRREAEA